MFTSISPTKESIQQRRLFQKIKFKCRRGAAVTLFLEGRRTDGDAQTPNPQATQPSCAAAHTRTHYPSYHPCYYCLYCAGGTTIPPYTLPFICNKAYETRGNAGKMLPSLVRRVPMMLRQSPSVFYGGTTITGTTTSTAGRSTSLAFRATFSTYPPSPQLPSPSSSAPTEDGQLTPGVPVAPEDRPFLHHGKRPRFRDRPKFKSPQKRASKLLHELNTQAVQEYTAAKPAVWETDFRVGDAVELEVVTQGGVNSDKLEKMRGVVLGIFKKKLDTSILIRDVLYGEPVERRVPLHSPLVKSLKVLERNFVFKGKKKIKRAKLYYLSERNPLVCQVTKRSK